jgi:hypothetical protein
MSFWGRIALGSILGSLCLITCCARQQAFTPRDAGTLVAIVAAYGQGSQTGGPASAGQVAEKPATASDEAADSETEYKSDVVLDLVQKNYDALDQTAREARASKSRFKGGVWKLYSFYAALGQPTTEGQATDDDWNYHIERFKAWESARPESAAARIALAATYMNYADKARGTGYANTVSESGWKLYNERVAVAASILADAAKLKEKCPYWYEAMQNVALAQGWDKAQARKLFDQAIAFEPTYYHYYREYANFLLPKWYGEPGEAEAFAEEISNKVGGQEGKFIYFELASLITCQCDSDDSHMENLSWPKIREGYAALGQLYGYSNLKMNRFAHMAVAAHDQAVAEQTFAAIGSDWDHTVWRSSRDFDNARTWAGGQ